LFGGLFGYKNYFTFAVRHAVDFHVTDFKVGHTFKAAVFNSIKGGVDRHRFHLLSVFHGANNGKSFHPVATIEKKVFHNLSTIRMEGLYRPNHAPLAASG
jgi:hypothetical protein